MNIYLVQKTDEINYGAFDAAIVVAENPKEAKKIFPYRSDSRTNKYGKNLSVKLIGSAKKRVKKGVVLVSFNEE